jgi:hypothetical protein
MGYEVVYYYHEEIEKGEYNKDETKSKTVDVGSPYDDVSLDVLAGKVMALLARRNILVVNVEIFEFRRKKISFKESNDGIVIKNRKFKFDDGTRLKGEDLLDDPMEQLKALLAANPELASSLNMPIQQPHEMQQNDAPTLQASGDVAQVTVDLDQPVEQTNLAPPSFTPNKPVSRYELFNPVIPGLAKDALSRGWKFTMGKKYPIYDEKLAPTAQAGMLYTTIDDDGIKRVMSDKFFTPEVANLSRDFESETFTPATGQGGDPRLDWGPPADVEMPEVR